MAETGPVTWIKHKYAAPKDKGRYKGGTSASAKATRKRKKVGGGPSPVEHVLVLCRDGGTRWATRPREAGRK